MRQLRRHRLVARVLRPGQHRGRGVRDHGSRVGERHPLVRHGRRLRRRAQRVVHRPLARGAPARRARADDEGLPLDGRRPRTTSASRPTGSAASSRAAWRGSASTASTSTSRTSPTRETPLARDDRVLRAARRRRADRRLGALATTTTPASPRRSGTGRPALVQNPYSLLDRGDEDEVLPLCEANGIAYVPFGPLSGGWLTGKYRRGEPFPAGSRMTLRPEPYEQFVDDARLRRARPAARRGRRARCLDGGARVRLGARAPSTAPSAGRTAPSSSTRSSRHATSSFRRPTATA